MFAGYPSVKGARSTTKHSSRSEGDPVLFALAILHQCPDFRLRLPGEGHSQATIGQSVDSPLETVCRHVLKNGQHEEVMRVCGGHCQSLLWLVRIHVTAVSTSIADCRQTGQGVPAPWPVAFGLRALFLPSCRLLLLSEEL